MPRSRSSSPNLDEPADRRKRRALGPQFNAPSGTQHVNSGPGTQFNAPNGTQNVNNGPGLQFFNSAFNGPVHFNHSSTQNEVLKLLYTVHYEDRKDRNPRRVPGTCEWFVTNRNFIDWRDAGCSAMLWVSADPGCGKSVLTKYLVDEVLLPTDSRAVCYFFFKDDFDDQKGLSSALCCLLRQLFSQKPHLLSGDVENRFLAGGSAMTKSPRELWSAILKAAETPGAGEIIFVLDALDECDDNGRTELYRALEELYSEGGAGSFKFLLTSRPYAEIHRGFKLLLDPCLPVIHLSGESNEEIEKISKEIDLVIQARVEDVRRRLDLTSDERDLLLERLLRTPNRTYLWVALVLDSTSNLLDIDEDGIRRITSELPRSVDEAYDKILCRSPDPAAAKKLLHIIVGAYEPLTLGQMSLAFSVREDHKTLSDIQQMPDARFERFLRHVCGLFVTVTKGRVYLLHQTVREFLVPDESSPENLENPRLDQLRKPLSTFRAHQWKHSLRSCDSHWILANACIQYLIIKDEWNLWHYDPVYAKTFAEYSRQIWFQHARQLPIESQEAITSSMLRVCSMMAPHWTMPSRNSSPALSVACDLGLSTVVKNVLSLDDTVLCTSHGLGRWVMSLAAKGGHPELVRIVLRQLKNPDISPFRRLKLLPHLYLHGETPLLYAIAGGSVDVIPTLLEAGACVTAADRKGFTVLHKAALFSRKLEMWRLLLEAGANHEARALDGRVAIHMAAHYNRPDIVQLLIDFGADFEARVISQPGCAPADLGWEGYTPLHFAAEYGRLETVQLLLKVGAQRNVLNRFGKTQLDLAISKGNSEIAALLRDP